MILGGLVYGSLFIKVTTRSLGPQRNMYNAFTHNSDNFKALTHDTDVFKAFASSANIDRQTEGAVTTLTCPKNSPKMMLALCDSPSAFCAKTATPLPFNSRYLIKVLTTKAGTPQRQQACFAL